MRVLFISDELFPSISANTRILFRVIDHLLGYADLQIEILGQARSSEQWAREYRGCPIINMPYCRFLKYQRINKKLGRLKFLRFFIYPRTILYSIAIKRGIVNPYVFEAEKWLKKKCNNYDVVVAMSMPYYNLEIAASVGHKVPVILYPLEPIATFDKTACDFEKKLDYEISLENKATKLVLTSLIHDDFLLERTRINEKKVVEAEFPCVFKRNSSVESKPSGSSYKKISLVYIGKFYPEYREPDYLCKLMDYLPDNEYELTVVGGLTSNYYKRDIVKKYLSNTHHSIRCVGFVSPKIADDYLMKADVLVHVGNKQSNIMPSKVLDYISTGKPIVNICKTFDCPTLSIMEKYPLSLTVFEEDGLDLEVAKRIDEFCKSVRGQKIPFDTIHDMFYKFTPEYVGQVFLQAIRSSKREFDKPCVE